MIVIGLTGSIGMGKSVTAAMLQTMGIPVHDADKTVHKLLVKEGPGLKAIRKAFPYKKFPQIYGKKSKTGNRAIKRAALGQIVFKNKKSRETLEKILHPLVRQSQQTFIKAKSKNEIVALDIPLLFETGGNPLVNVTLVVDAPAAIQKKRVMARPGMTEEKFHAILKRQMPNKEKCKRADYVLKTGSGLADAKRDLKKIITELKKK